MADSNEQPSQVSPQQAAVTSSIGGDNGVNDETTEEAERRKQLEESRLLDEIKVLEKALKEAQRKHEDNGKSKETDIIKFKDAVGRKFNFPFHLCQTWKGTEDLISQAFLHVDVVEPHVQEGHYELVGPNGGIILPRVWDRVIEPGWSITMHMWPMDKSPPLAQNDQTANQAVQAAEWNRTTWESLKK